MQHLAFHENSVSPDDLHHDALMMIEAIIFSSESPVSIARLKQALDGNFTSAQIKQLLQQLAVLQHGRSVELIETAQGYRFQVRAKYRQMIHRAWPERPIKLSPSLMEIVSVVAYHQPVTRADIEQIRGVGNNSQVLRTLFEWNWIKESGFRDVPGRPALLVTTPQFLNAFGLTSLNDLPPIQEHKEAISQLDSSGLRS